MGDYGGLVMTNKKQIVTDSLFTLITLLVVFSVNLFLVMQFNTKTMTPMIFVLGVFLVSWRTQGYGFGIAASFLSVLAVNWAFTYPYWEFDLISPECISSAVVMLIVSTMTGALTTRLKQQEKLKAEAEKERMRGNLLRAVSHDLRTPLTSIYGSCSAIIENFDSISRERQLLLLKDMESDAQWLNRMVENLLSVTRVDADKVRLSKHSTVLEELIDALLVKFYKHYPNQKVQVTIPEEFVIIPMDPMLIEQVLMNLLENAVFHAQGMKNLWLKVVLKNNKAVFFVEDDGCGISEERMAHLFTGILDSEAPVDSARSNMGIGLSVCRTIVKAHGGELKAENRPGGGALFCFSLEMEETDYVQ
jgi:two-component system sensor histidine kinase KdpD